MSSCTSPAPAPGAAAYALYLWSDLRARWSPLVYSRSLEICEGMRVQLVHTLGSIPTFVLPLEAYDADASEAGSFTLAPPFGGFVDPAPDGIMIPPSPFDDLVSAVALEVEYQQWRSDLLAFNPGLSRDDVFRYLFADERRDARDVPVFNG